MGQEAVKNYVENDCIGRFLQSIKTILPSNVFTQTYFGNQKYEADDLVAILLKEIKKRLEKIIGERIEKVTLGRPVIFSEKKENDQLAENRLLSAAKKAGFTEIDFQYEPVAAANYFIKQIQTDYKKEKIVLVADYGGGTSDFVIVQIKDRNDLWSNSKILGLGGIDIGGEKFNSLIMRQKIAKYFGKEIIYKTVTGKTMSMPPYFMSQLEKWHLISFLKKNDDLCLLKEIKYRADNPEFISNLIQLIEENLGYLVFQIIEKAKCELTFQKETEMSFEPIGIKIQEKITKSEFESIIQEDVGKLTATLNKTIRLSGLCHKDIDYIFTTGGTSLIPMVRKELENLFGKDKIIQKDIFTGVVSGLCL